MDWSSKVARAKKRAGVFLRPGKTALVSLESGKSVEITANEPLSVWETLRRAGEKERGSVMPSSSPE
jgi:hypothetical protein